MHDNLNTCSMHKQNVKKANKTTELYASCRAVTKVTLGIAKLDQNSGYKFGLARTDLKKRSVVLLQNTSHAICTKVKPLVMTSP